MEIKLVVQNGDHTGRQIPINVSEFIIGRDPACHYQIDHNLVSRRHCRIKLTGGRVVVEDLKSANGITLDDQFCQTAEVHHGQRLKVGPTTFLVMIEAPSKDLTRRVDEWCLNTLESRVNHHIESDQEDSTLADTAAQILDKLSHREGLTDGRERLRVGESHGITVVKFIDNAIVQDSDIREIERELIDLVDLGHRSILLNFGNVENLSTQFVGVLRRVHKLGEGRGSTLKVCNPLPKVAKLFSMTGLDHQFEVIRDERTALLSPWPEMETATPSARSAPSAAPARPAHVPAPAHPVPSAAPAARVMASAPHASGIYIHPGDSGVVSDSSSSTAPAPLTPRPGDPFDPVRAPLRVQLVVASGQSEGKHLEIAPARFLIGRDPCCQLRPNSPTISLMHMVIERRGYQVFVRDLGSTNGTTLNDRVLHAEEMEAQDGDRLKVGPLQFRFAIRARAVPEAPAKVAAPAVPLLDDLAASWLADAATVNGATATTFMRINFDEEPPPRPKAPAAASTGQIAGIAGMRYEVIEGVLVIALLTPDFNDESTVGPVRAGFLALFEQPLPRRVVLNMEAVTYLSSRALGLLLAHAQRLLRAGGKMRICHARPNVLGVLKNQPLEPLISLFPTVEEATLAPWE